IVRTLRATLADPVVQRLLRDEPDVLGRWFADGTVAGLVAQISELLTPVVRQAVGDGRIRAGDPALAAEWIVRIVLVLTAVPTPDEELEATVRFVLLPMLDAGAGS